MNIYSVALNIHDHNTYDGTFHNQIERHNRRKHNLNYDGTPISWVLRVERVLLETSYDILEDELLRNSFISFEDGNFILIGPYIDRSQLLLAQDYLNENYGKDLGVIEKWQI